MTVVQVAEDLHRQLLTLGMGGWGAGPVSQLLLPPLLVCRQDPAFYCCLRDEPSPRRWVIVLSANQSRLNGFCTLLIFQASLAALQSQGIAIL